jgi:hypothetical protein
MTTTPTPSLTDAVRSVAGEHFSVLEKEFVDFGNDLRVSNTRELMDLGLDRETADKVLYVVREAYVGKDISMVVEEA